MLERSPTRQVPASGPVQSLPAHYREVHFFSINRPGMLVWLNILSLVPLLVAGLIVFGALLVYHEELGAPLVLNVLPGELPSLVGLLLTLLVLPLHEVMHGVTIARYGHKPRYGAKLLVLFATSDGALFRRREFIHIALAPLVYISLGGALIMLVLPQGLAYWLALALVLNAAGAVGDLWMTAVVLRFDRSVLIRDEEDSMRIFAPPPSPAPQP